MWDLGGVPHHRGDGFDGRCRKGRMHGLLHRALSVIRGLVRAADPGRELTATTRRLRAVGREAPLAGLDAVDVELRLRTMRYGQRRPGLEAPAACVACGGRPSVRFQGELLCSSCAMGEARTALPRRRPFSR